MGLLRKGRDERDEAVRFQMREKMLSIGDDYWIEDSAGNKVFKVDGKALRVRDTWKLKDATDNDVAEIRERKLSVRDAMTVDVRGRKAVVKKKMVSIRDKFHVEIDGAPDIEAKGNFVDHEYEIEQDGHKIGEVSKRWFRVRETYGVEVFGDTDPVLVLALTVAIDAMSRVV
jgi:uncharacterized protein YxjI